MSAQSPPDNVPPSPRSAASPLNSTVPFIPVSALSPQTTDSEIQQSAFMSTAAMTMPPPTLGLRGEYNPELRKREEWARLAATLTALETMKEASPGTPKTDFSSLWAARDADFSFELTYQNRTVSAFDVLHQAHSVKLNALLLSPSRLKVPTRHQTATAIQKFTEANKNSLGVIVYLMDAGSSGNEQAEAVQSLGALHHCLSLGFSEPPPVLVVSDASYLLDCISAYMKSVTRANSVPVNAPGDKPLWPKLPAPAHSSFAAPKTSFPAQEKKSSSDLEKKSLPASALSSFAPPKMIFPAQDKKSSSDLEKKSSAQEKKSISDQQKK